MVALSTCHARHTLVLQKHIDKSLTTPILLKPERDPRRKLNKADIANIVKGYEAGHSRKQISENHGISRARVSQTLRWHGVESRMRKPNSAEVARMVRLYESGLSLAETGKAVGFDAATVRKYLLAHAGRGCAARPGSRAIS